MGLEPTTTGTTNQGSTIELRPPLGQLVPAYRQAGVALYISFLRPKVEPAYRQAGAGLQLRLPFNCFKDFARGKK